MLATNKYIENSSNRYACLLITEKIKTVLSTKYIDWNDFLKFNPNLDTFLMNNSDINIILKNNGCSITDIDYQKIINNIRNLYIIRQNNITSNTNMNIKNNSTQESNFNTNNVVYLNKNTDGNNLNSELNEAKEKTLIKNHNSGFMDALLLAFIVGAFMGTAFINLYARILQII